MICHGNGSAYHNCASQDVVRVQWNGRGTVYQVCPCAREEWGREAIANGEAHLKLVAVEE